MYKLKKTNPVKFITVSILTAMCSSNISADAISDKIADLQRQIDELKAAAAKNTEKIEANKKSQNIARISPSGPEVSFPGQYRMNFYSADNDDVGDQQTATRLRIRQSINLKFDEQFKTHLQLQLNHTTSNVSTAGDKDGNDVRVRHAVIDYTAENGIRTKAGIVPVTEYYNDAMYSWDWDYNPVAAEVFIPIGDTTIHAFAGNLNEGQEDVRSDDTVHYQVDAIVPLSGENQLVFSGTGLTMKKALGSGNAWHFNYGVSGKFKLSDDIALNGFIMGSSTNGNLLGSVSDDADGFAGRLEFISKVGRGNFGLLATYASGEKDGTGFLMPMAFSGTYGYWGYTGILTVQGPTDTGFDGDGVNISNNGYGLTSLQAKYSMPLSTNLDGYIAAGWFGNTDASGRDSQVGNDLLLMGTYHFNKVLSLDIGAAYAQMDDSVSGYWQGVQGGAGFNQNVGDDRNKLAVFGRLQASF